MEQIEFSSSVPVEMRDAVEQLFFFNPRQGLMHAQICETVDLTGVPEMREQAGRIWIDVPSNLMQCLFACNISTKPHRPVGVALYYRSSDDIVAVSHLAVDASSVESRAGVGIQLIGKVREIAHSIKGVTAVKLPYRRERFLRV